MPKRSSTSIEEVGESVQGAGLAEADLPNPGLLRRLVGLAVIGASQVIGRRLRRVLDRFDWAVVTGARWLVT
jgi:hypothetical protein